MEFTFRKWRNLKQKTTLSIIFPLVCFFTLSVIVLGSRYKDMLSMTKSHKSFLMQVAKNDALTAIATEKAAMRQYYLGLITVSKFEEVKIETQKALEGFSSSALRVIGEENILDKRVSVPLSNLRSDVLSGQKRWPEVKDRMEKLSVTIEELSNKYNSQNLLPAQYNWIQNFEALLRSYTSSETLKNDMSYIVLRDMPLNSEQFSNLVRSLERADFFREKLSSKFNVNTNSFNFFLGQQVGLWKKLLGHHNVIRNSVEQGRYGVDINKMTASFDKYQLSIKGGIQAYRRFIKKQSRAMLEKSRRMLLWNGAILAIFFLLSARLSVTFSRRALYYLATEMTGHDIKIISKSGGRRAWSKKVILLSDYQNHSQKESSDQKNIA